MKWLILAAQKCPKWLISGSIIVISSVIFGGWWMMRKPVGSEPTHGSQKLSPAEEIGTINFNDVVLVGNSLIDFKTGQILAKQWLEGFGDSLPPLAGTFPEDNLVIAANRGMAVAYGYDGKAKPMLSSDGKTIGAAAFNSSLPQVIYVRDGNLWLGKVDWRGSLVTEAKRITDTGVFRDDTFRGEWFWAGENLYVSILGRTHKISLTDGKTTPVQTLVSSLSRGANPDGKLVALPLGLGQFSVVEFEKKGEMKRFPTVGDIKQVKWLTPNRVAVLGSYRLLSIYDHPKNAIIGNFELKSQIQTIASNSPDGKYMLLGTAQGPKFLNTETGEFTAVTHPIAQGAWISNDTLLCSNPVTDSEIRGVWLYKLDGTKERISNQPIDSGAASGSGEPVIEVAGGVVYVSGGDLWFYETAENSLRRVTQDQKLTPNIKSLAAK